MAKIKSKKVSKTDPESSWFHKEEHKSMFAYSIDTSEKVNLYMTNILTVIYALIMKY